MMVMMMMVMMMVMMMMMMMTMMIMAWMKAAETLMFSPGEMSQGKLINLPCNIFVKTKNK